MIDYLVKYKDNCSESENYKHIDYVTHHLNALCEQINNKWVNGEIKLMFLQYIEGFSEYINLFMVTNITKARILQIERSPEREQENYSFAFRTDFLGSKDKVISEKNSFVQELIDLVGDPKYKLLENKLLYSNSVILKTDTLFGLNHIHGYGLTPEFLIRNKILRIGSDKLELNIDLYGNSETIRIPNTKEKFEEFLNSLS